MLPIKSETKSVKVSYVETPVIKIPSLKIPVHYLKVGVFSILTLTIAFILTSFNSEQEPISIVKYEVPADSVGLFVVKTIEEGRVEEIEVKESKEVKDLSMQIREEALQLLKDKWNPKARTFKKKGKSNSFEKQNTTVVVDKNEMLKYVPDFIVEEVLHGVPCLASITAGQADIEGNWWNSSLALKTNNNFGIKYVRKWDKDPDTWMAQYRDGHVTAHDDIPTDKFIKFKTKWACIRFHTKFLTLLSYKKHIGKDYKGWANGLRTSGYATDQGYTNALMERYNTLDLKTVESVAYTLRLKYKNIKP